MKICIPTTSDLGLEAPLSEHFGRAPFYSVLDVKTERVKTIRNPDCHRNPGSCHHLPLLKAQGVDAVACARLGRRAHRAMIGEGIAVLSATQSTVAQVLEAARAGELSAASEPRGCDGHGHR